MKKVLKSVISFIIVAAVSIGIRMITDRIFNVSDKREAEEMIDKYIDEMKDYVSGVRTTSGYQSDYWNVDFRLDSDWEMLSDEEISKNSQNAKQAAMSTMNATQLEQNLDEEIYAKLVDSIYAETEMIAVYVDDGMYVGQCSIQVMGFPGMGESKNEYYNDILNSIESEFGGDAEVTSYEATLGGETYRVINVDKTSFNGEKAEDARMYIRIKNDMACMIGCMCIDGYEDEFCKSLEECFN